VALDEDLLRIAAAAEAFAAPGEELAGVLPTEPSAGERIYLCAFARDGEAPTWIALDGAAEPVASRARVREAASIAALCELAEEAAGGGELEELRAQLVTLRLTEDPPGLDEAEEAALALETALGSPPRVASPEFLDVVGAAALRLEQALGGAGPSPFAEAMKGAVPAVDALTAEIERDYKTRLD
jgi:hypothetical protein